MITLYILIYKLRNSVEYQRVNNLPAYTYGLLMHILIFLQDIHEGLMKPTTRLYGTGGAADGFFKAFLSSFRQFEPIIFTCFSRDGGSRWLLGFVIPVIFGKTTRRHHYCILPVASLCFSFEFLADEWST